MCRLDLSSKPNMKKIHKAVQALESNIGFWGLSWILLKKLKNGKTFTGQISQGQYAYWKYLETRSYICIANMKVSTFHN